MVILWFDGNPAEMELHVFKSLFFSSVLIVAAGCGGGGDAAADDPAADDPAADACEASWAHQSKIAKEHFKADIDPNQRKGLDAMCGLPGFGTTPEKAEKFNTCMLASTNYSEMMKCYSM